MSLEQLHDRAAELGLRPTRLTAKGFRLQCPLCGGQEPANISAGNVHDAVAFCHKCGGGIALLRELGGNGRRLLPSERVQRDREQRTEEKEARARLTAIAGMVRPFDLGDIPPGLLWDPGRMPAAGMIGEKAAFGIEDNAGVVIGLDLYAMPGTIDRELVAASGRPKLAAVGGSIRGMWPRPKDAPSSTIAPETLFLVEGAPAAATVLGVGFSCAAFPNAAGLRDFEVGRVLARLGGRRAIVLADADDVGRSGAARSARLLRDRGADAIALDLFPDRHDGFDVADALRQHDHAGAADWLLERIKETTA